MLVVALGAVLGLAATASAAATCAGSGIATTGSGSVLRFSTGTSAVTQSLDLSSLTTDLRDLVISHDGRTAYIADHAFAGAGAVYVIDLATMARTATIGADAEAVALQAYAVALSPDGTRLYVADDVAGQGRVRIVDTSTNRTLSSYLLPNGADAMDIAVSTDGATLYVASDRLYAVTAATGDSVETLTPVGFDPLRIVLSPDGATRYILGDTAQSVYVQRGSTMATLLTNPLGGRGLSLTRSPDGATLYAGTENTASGSLFSISTATGIATPIGTTTTTFGTIAVAVKPDGTALFAGSGSRLDVLGSTGAVTGTISGTGSGAITTLAACPAVVPGAPTAVTADAGDTVVALSWAAPADTGGAAITRYTATAAPGGATCTTTGATTCLFTGVRNGTALTFTVTAGNIAGTSAASIASNRVTPRKDNRARALTVGKATVTYSKKGVCVAFNVTTTGAGVIAAAMTFKGNRYCNVSRRVTAAGTYRVKCVMKASRRALARKRTTTYTLSATFSPTNGPLASAKLSVVVKRRR